MSYSIEIIEKEIRQLIYKQKRIDQLINNFQVQIFKYSKQHYDLAIKINDLTQTKDKIKALRL